jgi:protein O-mannosyl-transferase
MYTSETASRGADLPPKLKRRGIFACAIAIVLAGLVYANALSNPFVYDDHRIIVENQSLSDLSNVRAILWHEVTRPVVNFSYAIDQAIWGPAPFGFHLTNVLLHMINVGLFALLIWGSTRRPHLIAPMAALLFAVHPMMTEAVGYISGRSEVICATFFLAALLSARASIVHRRPWWLAAAIVFWLLALASKEIAAMFPFVALAYDRWVIRGDRAEEKRRLLTLHLPLFGLAAVLVIVRLIVFTTTEHGGGIVPQWSFAFVEIEAMRRYLMMLLVPTGQALYHSIAPAGLTTVQTLTAIVMLALLVGLAWTRRKIAPLQSFGLLWFLLLLLPSSALVILDRGEPMAEHRVYLASCGVFLALAAAADAALIRLPSLRPITRTVLTAGLAIVVAALAGRTVVRNALWSSPVMVWLEAAELAPQDWLPHLLLGEELHRAGKHAEAVAAFRRVVQLRPQEVPAYGKLGVCLSEQGQLDEAAAAFARMKALDAQSAEASNGLALVALLRGQVDEARRGYLATLALDRSNIAARHGLAVIEETAGGNPAAALKWCEEIRRLAPGTPGNDECIRRNQARVAGGSGR